MKVGFAFFRACCGSPFSQLIALRTGGPYSHVEFYIPDSYVVEEGTGTVRHWCFSSYEKDGGVRWKAINITGAWWVRLEFEVDDKLGEEVLEWSNTQIGKAYDWAGIMGFVNPWRKGGDPGRWFCSEICHVLALRLKLLMLGAHRSDKVDPWKLYQLLAKDNNTSLLPSATSAHPPA